MNALDLIGSMSQGRVHHVIEWSNCPCGLEPSLLGKAEHSRRNIKAIEVTDARAMGGKCWGPLEG